MSMMTREQKYIQRQIDDAVRSIESRLAQAETEIRRLKSDNQQNKNEIARLKK